jgi:ABC-type transporter Mla maintaining outer membrane lipid asymmetry permease subunit MlaE
MKSRRREVLKMFAAASGAVALTPLLGTTARGVGEATTNSVVLSLLAIFIVNYFLSLILFKR